MPLNYIYILSHRPVLLNKYFGSFSDMFMFKLDFQGKGSYSSWIKKQRNPGPSCSKLTTSLVNDSLKFTSSDTQIC